MRERTEYLRLYHKARARAEKRLIAKHRREFDRLLAEERDAVAAEEAKEARGRRRRQTQN